MGGGERADGRLAPVRDLDIMTSLTPCDPVGIEVM